MAMKSAELDFDLIEEGRFKASVNEELRDAVAQLVQHVRQYGQANTAKAKAELNIKIIVQFDGVSEVDYSVKGAITKKTPGRPSFVTRAIHEQEQTGEERLFLFVRASGSDDTSPRQGKLCTDDGRVIDQESGKAAEKPGKKA